MSKKKISTNVDMATTSPAHLIAREDPEANYRSWSRNVADHLKDKSEEEIRQTLKDTANPFAVCFEHWIGDFNMATGVRNANGFNAKEIFYIGDKKWDRRAAVGVHNYTEVQWIPTIQELAFLWKQYTFVGIDNVPGSVPMADYEWPENTMMIFGEEGPGLTAAMQRFCVDIVHIEMFGSVRSFNCGVASGIAMYDFVTKHHKKKR
jgi:tRNA G18 (ribose-2'-O)-methylase SpoU